MGEERERYGAYAVVEPPSEETLEWRRRREGPGCRHWWEWLRREARMLRGADGRDAPHSEDVFYCRRCLEIRRVGS